MKLFLLFLFTLIPIYSDELSDEEVDQILKLTGMDQPYNYDKDLKKVDSSEIFKKTLKAAREKIKTDYPRLEKLVPADLKAKNPPLKNNSYLEAVDYLEKHYDFEYTDIFQRLTDSTHSGFPENYTEAEKLKKEIDRIGKVIERLFIISRKPNFKWHKSAGLSPHLSIYRLAARYYRYKVRQSLESNDFEGALLNLKKGIFFSRRYWQIDGVHIDSLIGLAAERILVDTAYEIIWENGVTKEDIQSVLETVQEFNNEKLKPFFINELDFIISSSSGMVPNNKEIFAYQITGNLLQKEKKSDNYEKPFDKEKLITLLVRDFRTIINDTEKKVFNHIIYKPGKEDGNPYEKGTYVHEAFDTIRSSPPYTIRRGFDLINRQRLVKLSAAIRLMEIDSGARPKDLQELVKEGLIPRIPTDAMTGGLLKYLKKKRQITGAAEEGFLKYRLQSKDTKFAKPVKKASKPVGKADPFGAPAIKLK